MKLTAKILETLINNLRNVSHRVHIVVPTLTQSKPTIRLRGGEDGKLGLNIGMSAVHNFSCTDTHMHFFAGFGGVREEMFVNWDDIEAVVSFDSNGVITSKCTIINGVLSLLEIAPVNPLPEQRQPTDKTPPKKPSFLRVVK